MSTYRRLIAFVALAAGLTLTSAATAQVSPSPAPATDGRAPLTCTLQLSYPQVAGKDATTALAVAGFTTDSVAACRTWARDVYQSVPIYSAYVLLVHDRNGQMLSNELCTRPFLAGKDKTICKPQL